MKHVYKKGRTDQTLVLLHGMGADEFDLLTVARNLDDHANVLSIRANVVEFGMTKFFKDLPPDNYNLDDVNIRVKEVVNFIKKASKQYKFPLEEITIVGYSNGANMALYLMLMNTKLTTRFILLHPLFRDIKTFTLDLSNYHVFIGAGENDPWCPYLDTIAIIEHLQTCGVRLSSYWHNSGHAITLKELDAARDFYINLK